MITTLKLSGKPRQAPVPLYYDAEIEDWETDVVCLNDPECVDSGNGMGATPMEALEQLAADWNGPEREDDEY